MSEQSRFEKKPQVQHVSLTVEENRELATLAENEVALDEIKRARMRNLLAKANGEVGGGEVEEDLSENPVVAW